MRLTRLLGLSLLGGATLITEIVLTRIFSVIAWYHFAFLAITVGLFGLALGGLALHALGRRLAAYEDALLTYSGAAMGAANGLVAALLATVRVDAFDLSRHGLLRLGAVFSAAMLPFIAAGFFVSLVLRGSHKRAGLVYLFDLAGAAAGCLATIPLLRLCGGPAALLAAGALAVGGGALAVDKIKPLRSSVATAVVGGLLAALLVHLASGSQLLEPRYVKGRPEPERLAVAWNSFSRVAASRRPDVGDIVLTSDGLAPTTIAYYNGDAAKTQSARTNLQRLPYVMKPGASTLIFGSGGGENILTALDARASQVIGVEYNPLVAEMARRRFRNVSGGLFELPNVRLAVDEGRSFIRRTAEKFDVIQFTLIDTWAATAAGAYALTENNVFTVEAVNEYLDRLRPGGILSIKRETEPHEVALRLAALVKAVVQARGARESERNFFVAHDADFVNIMAKNEPFGLREVGDVVESFDRLELKISYSPYHPGDDPAFVDLLSGANLGHWLSKQTRDLSPPTDNHPFLFYTLRLHDLPQALRQAAPAHAHDIAPALLLAAAGAALGFTLALILLPALLTRDPKARAPLRWSAYFALLGLGYLLVEVATMQRLILYLGHPTYALTVVLFTLLLSSGLGAGLSEMSSPQRAAARVRLLIGGIAFYTAAFMAISPRLFHQTLAGPLSLRLAVAAASLAPLGMMMGAPFPLGVRLVGGDYPRAVPWMYAVNAAAGVLGSALAMLLAVHWGYVGATTVGLAAYALACLAP